MKNFVTNEKVSVDNIRRRCTRCGRFSKNRGLLKINVSVVSQTDLASKKSDLDKFRMNEPINNFYNFDKVNQHVFVSCRDSCKASITF
jgi:hypothetical protein